jgi:uncharacterized protein (TIRG00374 family)
MCSPPVVLRNKLGTINEPGLVKSRLMSRLRSFRRWLLPALAMLIILVIVIWLIDLREVYDVLRAADARLLAASLVFLLAGNLLLTIRWRYLLANQPAFIMTLKSDGMSYLSNYFLHIPASIMRVVTLGRITDVSSAQAASSMVVDRLLEQIMRITCLLLALAAFARMVVSTSTLVGNILVILVGLGVVFWLIRNPETVAEHLTIWLARLPRVSKQRSASLVSNLVNGFVLAGTPARFGVGLLLSVIMWGCFFGFQALCLLALGFDLTQREIAIISLTTLAVATPSGPAMPGIYHGIVVAALALLGMLDASELTAYAIASHILQILAWLPLGIWGFLSTDLRLGELVAFNEAVKSTSRDNPPDDKPGQDEQGDGINEGSPAVRAAAGESEHTWDNQGAGDPVEDVHTTS